LPIVIVLIVGSVLINKSSGLEYVTTSMGIFYLGGIVPSIALVTIIGGTGGGTGLLTTSTSSFNFVDS